MTVRVERTESPDLVVAAATHPAVWRHLSDDLSPSPETWAPPMAGFHWLGAWDGDEWLGVFGLHPWNGVTFEIHTALLPAAWGRRATDAGRSALSWMFAETRARKIVTHVPTSNRAALAFAKRCGLVEEGRNRASFLKDGALLDQIILGITKEEHLRCL